MDNRINEIRRKIRFLRAEMLRVGDIMRNQIDRDEECSEAAVQLMAMRTAMLGLIAERNSLGGSERLLDVEERLKADYRASSRKPVKGALGRRERGPARVEDCSAERPASRTRFGGSSTQAIRPG
jgi:hypothetical protein